MSGYYHIAAGSFLVNTTTKKHVTRGTLLGKPSCEGGFSTGAHLHFWIEQDGQTALIENDAPYQLCGWTAHSSGTEYGGSMTRPGRTTRTAAGGVKGANQAIASNDACPGPAATPQLDVALIIASSGSMSWNDPANKRLDAAKAYLTASLPGDRVAVVDFATTARLARGLSPLPGEKQQLVAAINTIGSNGSTNIRDGIDQACAELKAHGSAARRGAILLTDGEHNQGPFGNPQQCFKDNGWPIFTFGFGSADEAFLTKIAADTGGAFKKAPTSDFVCEFQRVRGLIARTTPGPCTAKNVQPKQTNQFAVSVPASQAQVTFSSSWSGSDIAMSLVSPSGRVIDRNTSASDVVHDLGATFESYAITNPEAGDWQVKLFGLDVPPQGEDAVFNFVSIPKPPEPPTFTPTATSTATPTATATTAQPLKTHTPAPPTAAPPTATAVVQPTLAPPQPTATRVRAVLGTIRVPDTGSGPGGGMNIGAAVAAMAVAGAGLAGIGATAVRRRRRPR